MPLTHHLLLESHFQQPRSYVGQFFVFYSVLSTHDFGGDKYAHSPPPTPFPRRQAAELPAAGLAFVFYSALRTFCGGVVSQTPSTLPSFSRDQTLAHQ
jgi:hypothetical protein